MNIALFVHSLLSDWNHGNAHFLRGVASELLARGHGVQLFEPADAWSLQNLIKDEGEHSIETGFRQHYPHLDSTRYDLKTLDLDAALGGVDLVLAHEWNDPALIARLGEHRRANDYKLLFHDTHHRAVTSPAEMEQFDLSNYDGALVFGEVLRDVYARNGWASKTWTWHEAADTRIFRPLAASHRSNEDYIGDLIWVGNWGDGERTAELQEFLLNPAGELALKAKVHGVRYPDKAKKSLAAAGISCGGYLPNAAAPTAFSHYKFTVHVPRRPYVQKLPGIPTIRVFESLACGLPLICSPWNDAEHLFAPGEDYLTARSGAEMKRHMKTLANDPAARAALSERGLRTILARHTCGHRAEELLDIAENDE